MNRRRILHGRERRFQAGGFSLIELMIASALVVMLVGAFALFLKATGVSMFHLSSQSAFNQEAGHAAEFILSRVRLANTATNDPAGDQVTLSYDDDPDRDSNEDGLTWNDLDHFERFKLELGDGRLDTLEDNQIRYQGPGADTFAPLVHSGVRKLPGLPVFWVTNKATVLVHFGLLYTNQTAQSQSIEIRTQSRLRNRIE